MRRIEPLRRALLAACLISIAAQSNAEETRFMRFANAVMTVATQAPLAQ